MKHTSKRTIKLIGSALTILSIAIIAVNFIKMDVNLSFIENWYRALIVLLFGIILMFATILIGILAWKKNLEYFSERTIDYKNSAVIYTKANIGKYLPGNVMHYVERNIFAAEQGISQIDVTTSTILEIVGQVFTSFLITIPFLFNEIKSIMSLHIERDMTKIFLLIFMIALILMFVISRKNEKVNQIFKKITQKKFAMMFAGNICLYGMCYLIYGLLLNVILYHINPNVMNLHDALLMISANTIAWLIGFIIPGVPGGIGVRELTLTTIASGTAFEQTILIAAVFQRIISIFGDLTSYLWGLYLSKKISFR